MRAPPWAITQLEQARQAIADLVGADPSCVVLGPTRQYLTHALARGLSSFVRRGAGVVLSRSDAHWFTAPSPTSMRRSAGRSRTSAPVTCLTGSTGSLSTAQPGSWSSVRRTRWWARWLR